MRMRMHRGDALDAKVKRLISDLDEFGYQARAGALLEPTKRELREQIAEAVRNTAAMQRKGNSNAGE